MKLRFGYVSHALSLWEASPARTMTFKTWEQQPKETRLDKLISITKRNLNATLRAIHYNIAHEFPIYRMSSSIVPLATHPEVMWDYLTYTKKDFEKIGELINHYDVRVSFHPSQFTVFTSEQDHVIHNSIVNMKHHYKMLEAMKLAEPAIINIHVGGAYGNKEQAKRRFHENIRKLPKEILSVTTLENDDKTYSAEETLELCEQIECPFIFDYHHHVANPSSTDLEEILIRAFRTWDTIGLRPKVHLSSPRSKKQFRSHHDHVDLEFSLPFLKTLKKLQTDVDVMIEAKTKDQAVIQFLNHLEKKRGYKRINGGTFKV